MKKRALLVIFCAACVFQGCATQADFSQSFPHRLMATQADWYAHNPLSAAPPQAPSPATPLTFEQSLQNILDRLVYASPLRGHTLAVLIANDNQVNAHTDGRTIFLNAGLLMTFRGNDELVASVLAHELGHILAGHQENHHSASGLTYLSYLTPALGVLPYGGLYGSVAGTAMREGDKMREYSYSRLQENEADAIGAFLAIDAGYTAIGLSEFLDYVGKTGFSAPRSVVIPTSLVGIPQSAAVALLSSSPLYSTHPPSKKRKHIVDLIIKYKNGLMTRAELRKEEPWLADICQAIEFSRPKV